jgi:hypothetical protein
MLIDKQEWPRPTMIEVEDTLEQWGGFNYGKRLPEGGPRITEEEIAKIARLFLEQFERLRGDNDVQ